MCEHCAKKAGINIVSLEGKGFKLTFDASELLDEDSNIALDKSNKELVISLPDSIIQKIENAHTQSPISLEQYLEMLFSIRQPT